MTERSFTIWLLESMDYDDAGGFFYAYIKVFNESFAKFVNPENFVFQASSIDIIFKYINFIRLIDSCKNGGKKS